MPTPKGTAAANKAWRTRRAQTDDLPPHATEAEEGALSCVIQSGDAGSQQNVEAMLHQLRPTFFYDHRCRTLHAALVHMRMDNKAVDSAMLLLWLKANKSEGELMNKLEECGGKEYLNKLAGVSPSPLNFNYYLPTLKEYALRRYCLAKQARLGEIAKATELTPEQLREEFSELYEQSANIGTSTQPLIHIVSPAQAKAFEPDPGDYLIGDGLITRGTFVTIAGVPGVGKSRLATTLAVAGARGNATWMKLPVRSKWNTLILQQENSSIRLKKEFSAVPEKFNDNIRISDGLSHGLAFDKPEFRRELRRIWEDWPFDMLVIDPWNKVTAEDGQKDYMEAMVNIEQCFRGVRMPTVVIVAHLRKRGRDEGNRSIKKGRELLDEISGSLGLGSSSRSVFTVQAVSSDLADYRIIFDIAKNNDDENLDSSQTRSAWIRANGAFEAINDFDWDEVDNPGDPERRKVTEEMVSQLIGSEKPMNQNRLAKRLSEEFKIGQSTAHRAIGPNGYLGYLLERDSYGFLSLKNGNHKPEVRA